MISHDPQDLSAHAAVAPTPGRNSEQLGSSKPIDEANEHTDQMQRQTSSTREDVDTDAFVFDVCASQPPPVVDLSVTLAKRLAAYELPNATIQFLCRHFGTLAMLFRVAMACFIVLLFLPQGRGRVVLSAVIPLLTLSVVTTMLLLSTDVFFLLVSNYEFWFLTVMNALNWIVLASVVHDARVVGCFTAWFAYQSVILVDANHRTYATTLSSTKASAPILVGVAVCVAMQCIKDGSYFEVHLRGRRIGDASDLVTFTTSTLVLFFIKLLIVKKTRSHRMVRGFTVIPCATLKTILRLVPTSEAPSFVRNRRQDQPQAKGARHQELKTSSLPFVRVDARRTLLPYRLWYNPPHRIVRNASRLRVGFYAIGFLAYASLTFVTLRRFYALWVRSTGMTNADATSSEPPSLARYLGPEYWILLMISGLATTFFCMAFILFYQRDLMRTLLRNFDFVFTAGQAVIFHICLCDANYWEPDIVALVTMWDLWFFWSLSLDALTPLVKHRVFRFQKRFAAPVLASVIVGTAATTAFVLFIPDLGFRDRVVWSYTLSSGVTFSVRSQAVLVGRSVTIVLWCSRQVYLLFARQDDELNLIRGGIEYLTPFPLISATISRIFVSTRSIATLPLVPLSVSDDVH